MNRFLFLSFLLIAFESLAFSNLNAPICSLVGAKADPQTTRSTVMKQAWDSFYASLTPAQQEIIHKPSEIWQILDTSEKSLPGRLKNDPVTKDENFAEIQDKFPAFIAALNEAYELSARYESEIYQAASHFTPSPPDSGITAAVVESRASELLASLIQEVRNEPGIEAGDKQIAIARLSDVKIFTVHSIQKMADPFERNAAILAMSMTCRNDLSATNAFTLFLPKHFGDVTEGANHSHSLKAGEVLHPRFIVCPAVASAVADTRFKREALDFILAHELSHVLTMDPNNMLPDDRQKRKMHPVGLDEQLLRFQRPILECMEHHFGPQFRSLAEVEKSLEPIVQKQLKDHEGDVGFSFFGSQEAGLLKQATHARKSFTSYLGHEPKVTDTHAAEILADQWAIRLVSPKIRDLAEKVPLNEALGSYLAFFCSFQTSSIASLPDGDEGFHPSISFRIENLLRAPALEKLLADSSTVHRPSGPFCGLK